MALSSAKRALIAVVVIVCAAGIAGAIYVHRWRQPLPAASSGPAPGILDELPPDAPAIAYIDVAALRKLQGSPLAGLLGLTGTDPSRRSPERMDRDYAQFVHGTGFDYTRDLDRAAIAFWPNDLTPAANEAGENPSLAIADGQFDQHKITAYALRVGGRAETIDGRTRYTVPGKPTVAFEFLSPTRIAIASGKDPGSLLHLLAHSTRDSALEARIQRVAGAPIFGVARTDHLAPGFYADFQGSPQLEHVVRSIQSLSLSGQPQGGQIRLVLDAECDSMPNAIELSALLDTFRIFGAMSLSDPKTRRELQMTREQAASVQALIQQAKISHQQDWVRVTFDITPAMLGAPPQRAHRGRSAASHSSSR